MQASTGMSSQRWHAGFRKHVIPMQASRAKAWDLCFLKPSKNNGRPLPRAAVWLITIGQTVYFATVGKVNVLVPVAADL